MKKRRLIKISLISLVLILAVFFISQILIKINHKAEVKENLRQLPNVELQNLEGQKVQLHQLIQNEKIILAYINTECGICTEQMLAFQDILPQLKNTSIVLVSGQALETLQDYKVQNNFLNQPKIKFTHDYNEHFYMEFDIKSTPHFLIYDKNGDLLLNHKGYLKADKLLEVME